MVNILCWVEGDFNNAQDITSALAMLSLIDGGLDNWGTPFKIMVPTELT